MVGDVRQRRVGARLSNHLQQRDLMLLRYIAVTGRWIFTLWYLATGGAWLFAHAIGLGAAHRGIAPGSIAFQKALTDSQFAGPIAHVLTCFFGGAALLIASHITARHRDAGACRCCDLLISSHTVVGNWIWGTFEPGLVCRISFGVVEELSPHFGALGLGRAQPPR